MNSSTEKLLVQTYKHVDEARSLLEEVINRYGQQQTPDPQLPEDIQYLVQIALQLTPEQRKTLRLFLESIRDS